MGGHGLIIPMFALINWIMRDSFFYNPSHPVNNLTLCYPHIRYQLNYKAKVPPPTKLHPSSVQKQ
jgi:hypothetical protein